MRDIMERNGSSHSTFENCSISQVDIKKKAQLYRMFQKKKIKKKKSRPMLFRKPEEFSKKFEYFFHDCKLQFIPNILMSRT